jgi:outer membrane lipoprotein carrier protein
LIAESTEVVERWAALRFQKRGILTRTTTSSRRVRMGARAASGVARSRADNSPQAVKETVDECWDAGSMSALSGTGRRTEPHRPLSCTQSTDNAGSDLVLTFRVVGASKMQMKLSLVVVILSTIGAPSGVSGQARDTPDELAARIQQRYDGIRDFEGDFVQSYEGGVLRVKTTERGTVAIKRPGRMRWVYTQPERKEFVSDGTRIYSYLPADRQVIVAPLPAADQTTPALFLAGRGHLVRDFSVTFTELPGVTGLRGLKLVPKKADPELEGLILGVDPTTHQIRHLVAIDGQGGQSTFSFNNLKENRNLSDKIFTFQIPRGVEVITNGTPGR